MGRQGEGKGVLGARVTRRAWLGRTAAALLGAPVAARGSNAPIRLGVTAEFGLKNSTSAQAIELGMRVAIAQVNAAGGVLGGRPLELVVRDDHSMPARALAHLRELAAMDDVVAVFGGKFSPVMIEAAPVAQALKMPLMAVWSSADPIVGAAPGGSFVFRVGLRDSLAMPHMLDHARRRGLHRAGLLLANTGWGRSNLAAAERHVAAPGRSTLAGVSWHNWGETSLLQRYRSLVDAGAEVVLLVANDDDAAVLVRELAAADPSLHRPLLCHQGITGGKFAELAGAALQAVDLSVLQTFSFFRAPRELAQSFFRTADKVAGIGRPEQVEAPTGAAHAHDATHLLARAIQKAGSTDRVRIRDALEQLPAYRGLVKLYRPAFAPDRHEALGPADLLMARYRADGVMVPDEG